MLLQNNFVPRKEKLYSLVVAKEDGEAGSDRRKEEDVTDSFQENFKSIVTTKGIHFRNKILNDYEVSRIPIFVGLKQVLGQNFDSTDKSSTCCVLNSLVNIDI